MRLHRKGLPFYVYVLRDPRDGVVRKVGITQTPRRRLNCILQPKWSGGISLRVRRWIVEMRTAGVEPEFFIIATTRRLSKALHLEKSISIALRLSGVPLVNSEGELQAQRATPLDRKNFRDFYPESGKDLLHLSR